MTCKQVRKCERAPRRYSVDDLSRIIRIVCEEQGAIAVQSALREARLPDSNRQGCKHLESVCQESYIRALLVVAETAVAVVALGITMFALFRSPIWRVILRRFPALRALEVALRTVFPEEQAMLTYAEQATQIRLGYLPKVQEFCRLPAPKP